MAKDYYSLLGVSRAASQEEIKKAFRALAHQHHPDKQGGTEEKFKEINEAYQVLSNPEKRQRYDQFGSADGPSGFGGFSDAFGGRAGSTGQNGNFSFEFGDLGDLFGDFFGGGSRQQNGGRASRSRAGADLAIEIALDFKEAVFGITRDIEIKTQQSCRHCSGSGAEPGSAVKTCPTCKGSGQVVRNIGFGIGIPAVCPDCDGRGQRIEKKCKHCGGVGVVQAEKKVSFKIPAGIDTGQRIRLTGEGNAGGHGAPAGDLYVSIRVRPDKHLVRDGYDITSTQTISFAQAVLGTKIDVTTVDGPVTLKIPEGTQTETLFRLKSHGVPHLNGRGRGDHLVKVSVTTPTRLSRRQKELLAEFDEAA